MKAALISLGSISSHWIADEMSKLFDDFHSLDIRDIEVFLGGKEGVFYQGKPLPHYDCIYAKGSFRYATLLRALTTVLYEKSYLPLKPAAFTNGHDKLLTHLKLQAAQIPQPKTYLASTADAGKRLLKKIEYPIVMKLPAGTHGKGVMLADSYESASSMIDALALLKQPFIMQEYVETDGIDTRAIVVGDEVVASARRTAAKGEKRANIHAGGTMTPVELDEKTKEVAIATARVLGCDIAAVDMLMSPKGPLVIEINLSPGLQGITRATGKNVASSIAKFLKDKCSEWHKRKAGHAVQELIPGKEIVTALDVRGSRILLPEYVTKMSKLHTGDEVVIKVEKGKVGVERA